MLAIRPSWKSKLRVMTSPLPISIMKPGNPLIRAGAQVFLQDASPAIPSFVQQTSHLLRANVKGYKFHPPYAWGAIAYYNLWIE